MNVEAPQDTSAESQPVTGDIFVGGVGTAQDEEMNTSQIMKISIIEQG